MTRFLFRRRREAVLAVGLFGLASGTAAAQSPPPPAPLPLTFSMPVQPLAATTPVEVYYGTRKVAPVAAPTPPPVVKPVAKPRAEEVSKPRVESPIYIPIIPSPLWGTSAPSPFGSGLVPASAQFTAPQQQHSLLTFASVLLNRLFPTQPRTLTLSNANLASSIPNPMAASDARPATTAAPQPTVVIVREPAPEVKPAATPLPVAGFHMTPELIFAGCISGVCLLSTVFLVGRSSRPAMMPVFATATPTGPTAPPLAPVAPAAPHHDPERDGPLLMGQYRVGPLPQTAEPFVLGPTFHEEQEEKKRREEANAAAAVGLVMAQNLTLADELREDAVADGEAVVDAATEPEPVFSEAATQSEPIEPGELDEFSISAPIKV